MLWLFDEKLFSVWCIVNEQKSKLSFKVGLLISLFYLIFTIIDFSF